MKINTLSIDCDQDKKTADSYNVEGYPTIKLERGTQVVEYDAKPELSTLKLFLEDSLKNNAISGNTPPTDEVETTS